MNRFDRITAILIQLQSKKVVKAQDLADRFGISLRTVYRDIRSLEEAGVPLYGEAGIGYSLVEGYRLPPVMFTPDEAVAFITAEKLMQKFSDTALQSHFNSAMFKVKAVLRGTEKDLLENLDQQIVVTGKKHNKVIPQNILDILLKAIADKKVVKMVYKAFGNDDSSERLLEPIGVFHEYENWYTIAYCHLRNAYRQFRIDRVVNIQLTDIPQEERASLKEFQELKEQEKKSFNVKKVVLRVSKSITMYLEEHRHYHGFVSEKNMGDKVEMTFLTQFTDPGMERWIMMFADKVEIIEPEELKDRVCLLIDTYSQKYSLSKNLLT
ncbi:YafY family transcriptional regulator [Flavobacterium zepuense]|uniref:YafY family transcriptional regulator n=1 Tax=Flavobacterium zepuense TaxID=2593302 RepID=A0A552V098_9FLAO|nr:YafY family protein [Flavobacterium zepuense]TRW23903.1 YafY family transcriptional regulator [Flavobacterium zepuense]